jgi:hypothetical protein
LFDVYVFFNRSISPLKSSIQSPIYKDVYHQHPTLSLSKSVSE